MNNQIIVSGFKSVKDSTNPFNRNVLKYLQRIKDGANQKAIEQYRETKDPNIKSNLPGVCFSGTFTHRSASGLKNHSGLLVLDFDKLDDPAAAVALRDSISSQPWVFAAFVSPSGVGVKVLVKIPADPDNHKKYFKALRNEINSPNLDDSGADVCRFCFESYDPDIYINPDCETFINMELEEIEELGQPKTEIFIPQKSESNIVNLLMVWFEKKYGATKGNRNNNLFKLAMAFSDFGVKKIVAESHLAQFAESDFKESEILTIVRSAYERGFYSFGTKFFEDHAAKIQVEKQIRSGKSKADLSKWMHANEIEVPDVSLVIDKVKESMLVNEFWKYTKNGKIELSIHKYKFWLEQNNFLKYFPTDSGTFQFIKKEQNLIEETTEKRIKDFVLNDLMSRNDVGFGPFDFMAGNTRFFSSDYLSMLDSADIKIKEDTKEQCFLYFKNCALEVTQSGTKEIDFLDLDGYVWKNQIINRDYLEADHHESEFRTFVWKISGADVQKYNTFKSVIGYLLHSYKTSANNKAIIFNDETISENPNGGSGKGLLWNALAKMKKISMIDGKTFDFQKSFPYQTVSTDCQVLVFDDVKKSFNFESLFSIITEGLTIEYKGQDAIKIPVEKSPKILITTNYTIGGVGGSFDRRRFEIEMSAYFSASHTPFDEFGHMLFDDWNADEWARFDQYMVNCIQYYLKNGLVYNEFNNLHLRKFIKDTSFEFYEWSNERDNLPLNVRLSKAEYFEKLISEYVDLKKWLSRRKFKQMLNHFCDFHKMEYTEGSSNGVRWFMLSDGTDTPDHVEFDNEDETPF